MPGPTRRALTQIYPLLASGLLVFVVFCAWPGLITSYSCAWSIDPTSHVNGGNYTLYQSPLDSNYTVRGGMHRYEPGHLLQSPVKAWGFTFTSVLAPMSSAVPGSVWQVSITEPQGTTYLGAIGCCNLGVPVLQWFTPDGRAGVTATSLQPGGNLTLYVET